MSPSPTSVPPTPPPPPFQILSYGLILNTSNISIPLDGLFFHDGTQFKSVPQLCLCIRFCASPVDAARRRGDLRRRAPLGHSPIPPSQTPSHSVALITHLKASPSRLFIEVVSVSSVLAAQAGLSHNINCPNK